MPCLTPAEQQGAVKGWEASIFYDLLSQLCFNYLQDFDKAGKDNEPAVGGFFLTRGLTDC